MQSVPRIADVVVRRIALAPAAADDSNTPTTPIETTLADLTIEAVR